MVASVSAWNPMDLFFIMFSILVTFFISSNSTYLEFRELFVFKKKYKKWVHEFIDTSSVFRIFHNFWQCYCVW
jgi:hypothetical protein